MERIHSVSETARLLGLTTERVRCEERRALRKMAAHPLMREIAAEMWPDSYGPECDEFGRVCGGES